MLNFGDRQTTLDLNGPVLSIVQQPSNVSIVNAGVATFVGLATATFPTQTPANNPTNTGILTQRWYVDGFGPLSDGINSTYGFSVAGSATTTLTITNATGPANGLNIFMRPDYIPSAYSQPVGSAVIVGTARSTGNGNNEPFDTINALLTVFPTLTITSQPSDATVPAGRSAVFTIVVASSDGTPVSYQWYEDGVPLTDGTNISGSNTSTLTIARDTVATRNIYVVVTHPTSGDSPLTSNTVTFDVVDPRQIVIFENIYDSTSAGITEWNLFDNPVTLGVNINRSLLSFYASEKDIEVEMEFHGSRGVSSANFRGGVGGYSKIRLTLKQNEEYVFAGLAGISHSSIFLYRKSRLIASVGNGGSAGSNGRGGDGGGVNVAGERGGGREGGNGGELYSPGTLPSSGGIFGSLSGINPPNGADSLAPIPLGGRALACPRGRQTVSPCTDLGTTRFLWGQSTPIPNTGLIDRGFKQGYGIRQTAGRAQSGSGGGFGGGGATGGSGGTSGGGGGGGGGYTDGSVTILETQLGGSQYTNAIVIIRTVQ